MKGMGYILKKMIRYLHTSLKKVRGKMNAFTEHKYEKKFFLLKEDNHNYEEWIKKTEQKKDIRYSFEFNPKISLIVIVNDSSAEYLEACIKSVMIQSYKNWELYLLGNSSVNAKVIGVLEKYKNNSNIKAFHETEESDVPTCINSILENITGEYTGFLCGNDTLSSNAFYEIVKCLNENSDTDYIYSDGDMIDSCGNRKNPLFKPDWSPDTLMSYMYTGNLSVYKKDIIDKAGRLNPKYKDSYHYDLVMRVTELTDKIMHIPQILYHCREQVNVNLSDTKAYKEDLQIKQETLNRRGISAYVEEISGGAWTHIIYKIMGEPKVSIVIPSKDNFKVLQRCIDSIYLFTTYSNFEIILIDNGSDVENQQRYSELAHKYNFKYIYKQMNFNFSKMCNIAANEATGDYLLFLNDDTEVIESGWLERMLGQAQQKHIGAVGAKLIYPESKNIQHVGVINVITGPVHAFLNGKDDVIQYNARNITEHNYIAVTAACLLLSKEKFDEVGGFEEALSVAYNDVDLCFKLVEKGYYNVVRTDVKLYHYESVSRGNDLADESKMNRLLNEQSRLYDRHPNFCGYDPYYNINMSQGGFGFKCNSNYMGYGLQYVKEANKHHIAKYRMSEKMRGSIDLMRVSNRIFIEGWGFLIGYGKNNGTRIKLLLCGDKKNYLVYTNKKHRADLQMVFNDTYNVEYTGFYCEILKKNLLKGVYDINIICNNKRLETGKKLVI